jgi:hypothetical protein
MSRTKDHVLDTITTWDDAIDGPLPAWLRRDLSMSCLPTQADHSVITPPRTSALGQHQRELPAPRGAGVGQGKR